MFSLSLMIKNNFSQEKILHHKYCFKMKKTAVFLGKNEKKLKKVLKKRLFGIII